MELDVNLDGKNAIGLNVGYAFYLYGSEGGTQPLRPFTAMWKLP